MKLKTGDKVVVIAGKDKGKEGKIVKILKADSRVVVEGVNMVKKHQKSTGDQPGSIIETESPVHISNIMIVDPKTKKSTRIGHTTNKAGKKVRVTKKSNEILD